MRLRSLLSGSVLLLACGGNGGNADDPTATGITAGTTGGPPPMTTSTSSGSEDGSDESGSGSTGEPAQACEASSDCPEGEICAAGLCVEHDGPCEDDGDCTGDTYCCDEEDCLPEGEEGGYCIPYGEGPRGDTNPECTQDVVIGLFEPSIQCEWTTPDAGDPFPNHANVLTTPLVAQLPHDSDHAGEIVIVTYNSTDGGGAAGYGQDPTLFGVIRILNGETCEVLETIDDPANRVVAASPPAIGDIDGDGNAEIVTHTAISGLVAFEWNGAQYQTMWTSGASDMASVNRWDGPALHDLDDDGIPEVVSGAEVYDGLTGARLNPGQSFGYQSPGVFAVVGDLDQDGTADLVADDIYRWDVVTNQWVTTYPAGPGGRHYAYADFGTPGATAEDFDDQTLDGIAEIVTIGDDTVTLYTLGGQLLLSAPIDGGGPPTIGDFDNDGLPEIASAGGTQYVVYDLDCAGVVAGCPAEYIRWTQPSQDASSSNTGSSIFDFEGDGKAEAVYGDECFLRVYEGITGDVLYSAARTSCTWYENPIVADPDFDDNTEVLVGSNSNCSVSCPEIDPIHRGVRCEDGAGCLSGMCDEGFCRCNSDADCSPGHQCEVPPAGTPGVGNTCRAEHPAGIALSGVRVLRDRLDRWSSSRPLWNQHAYSITNIDDDLSIDATGMWDQNFADAELNNYRQNMQGAAGAEDLPDITGKLEETACNFEKTQITLEGTVCNRGLKAVAAALPATFYLGEPDDSDILCVAYTSEPVPVGECREVSCPIDNEVTGLVTMVVNDDGMGGMLTIECIYSNNTDQVEIMECDVPG